MKPIPLNFLTMYADLAQNVRRTSLEHGSVVTRTKKKASPISMSLPRTVRHALKLTSDLPTIQSRSTEPQITDRRQLRPEHYARLYLL
jgi:hypothetical protein